VTGPATTFDQLTFTIDRADTTSQRSPIPPANFTLPVKIALLLPAGTTGTVHVSAAAAFRTEVLAAGAVDVALVNGRGAATLTLNAAAPVKDMGRSSDLVGEDLAGTSDLSACSVVTTCKDGDGCCPSGCSKGNDNDCGAICGNGVVETGEICDDGNTVNGDGCDPTCQWTGIMTTLSGVAGSCGYADGTASRLVGPVGGITADSQNNIVYLSDDGTATIRQFTTPLGNANMKTIIGSAYDARLIDGSFSTARIKGSPSSTGTPLVYVSGNQKLYFSDDNGTSRVLREVDFVGQTVTTIANTVVKNNPIALAYDGSFNSTTIYYLGSAGDVDKWTVGDSASTQIATAAQIATVFGGGSPGCISVGRFEGQNQTLVGCTSGIVAVTDAGTVVKMAGALGSSGCSDGTNLSTARFNSVSSMTGLSGLVEVSDCEAVRRINAGDGGAQTLTLAGTLGANGFTDGPAATALFGNSRMPILDTTFGLFAGDSANCALRKLDSAGAPMKVSTVAGPAALHVTDVRGSANASRYVGATGAVTDGTSLYLLGSSGGQTAIISIDLTTGTSKDVLTYGVSGRAITRIGSTLYVALSDGTIHSLSTDGSNDAIFAGMGGNETSPPSDGVAGNLRSAVIDPKALTTDGSNLYFFDGSMLVRKIDLAANTVSLIAGQQSSTDVVDGSGSDAHFANFFIDLVYAQGRLYLLDGPFNPPSQTYPVLLRRITLATRLVETIAGTTSMLADYDGVGLSAAFAGAPHLGTDGESIFLSDTGPRVFDPTTVLLRPTIRQFEIDSGAMTTMVGQRGQYTILNGTGTKAIIHSPGVITFDTTTHSLYFFDDLEGVVQKIR
jgi:cysteine-rich repeat protein